MDEKQYWVGFNLVKGIGARRMQSLLAYFGDVETAWNAAPDLLQAAGLSVRIVSALSQVRESNSLERVW